MKTIVVVVVLAVGAAGAYYYSRPADVEGAANLDALGPMRQVDRQHGDARDALVALVLEVMLGQPQGLVPQRVGGARQGRRGVERLGEPLIGISAVVGGHTPQPTALQLDVADVESREAGDHRGPSLSSTPTVRRRPLPR